jgi:hypothetical protein
MGPNPSSEATSRSAFQQVPSILWNTKVRYREPAYGLCAERDNSIQTNPLYSSKIRFNIILPLYSRSSL